MVLVVPAAGHDDGMDVATLTIAVLGLVLAAVSLSWQVVQHLLSGPRVAVELLWGGTGPDRVATGPIRGSLDAFRHAGVSDPIFAVKGRNRGRLPVDVTGFTVELEGAGGYSVAGWRLNPELPHRLNSGSEVAFYVPLNDVQRAVDMLGERYRGRLRGRLDLASGSAEFSEWVPFPRTVVVDGLG